MISPFQELKKSRETLLKEFRSGGHEGFESRNTAIMDQYFLRSLQESATAAMLLKERKPFSLVALGGYGRGDLCLLSDIDVMILFDSSIPREAARLTDEIVLPLWDLGLEPGNCVRTIGDCIALAQQDYEVFTSILDARFLCGESRIYLRLRESMAKRVTPKKSTGFSLWLEERNRMRMDIFGDASYLLEPNLKEGIGGLRDYHQILWLSKSFFGIQTPRDLEYTGRLSHGRYEALARDVAFLNLARNHLHDLSGRKNDRLGFEYQEAIAARLGFEDKDGYPAVEQFLGILHRAMASIKALRNSFTSTYIRKGGGWDMRGHAGSPPKGIWFKGDQVAFESVTSILQRPLVLMEIFSHISLCGCSICMEGATLVNEFLHLLDDRLRSDKKAVEAFLDVLNGEHAFEALVQMHDTGILDAFIPEFANVRDRVQFDAYHIYPVGVHCLHTVKNLTNLSQERNLLLVDIMKEIKDPMLLYLAGLFHDIGKVGKGHSERGAEITKGILARFGFDPRRAEEVVFLVRNHLLLVESATRRDLNDEKSVVQCASTIETIERAKMLYLLTWADSKATGPTAWNEWIASLLTELFLKVLHILEKGELATLDAKKRAEQTKGYVLRETRGDLMPNKVESIFELMSPRYLLNTRPSLVLRHISMAVSLKEETKASKSPSFRLQALPDEEIKGCWEISFLAPDRAGLFSEISGVLALNGVNILSAQIYTWLDGTAVDLFKVSSPPDPLHPDRTWQSVEKDLAVFWGKAALLESRIKEKTTKRIILERSKPPRSPQIRVDNTSSDFFSIIEVFADDRLGLLHLITSTLSSLGLDIKLAKIATKGDQVADVFYVRDMDGQKLEDKSFIDKVVGTLSRALGGNADEAT